jgi:exodeoxyribonuclease VII large subunit
MNRLKLVDVMIVGRGGGSLEDLWAFNEEVVARAVYRSHIPVISAVGHETDWTICDFVADLRAPTPSAAAELVISSSEELRNKLEFLTHRLRLVMESRLAALDARLEAMRGALHDPATMLGHLSQRVDDLTARLDMALHNSVARRRERFERLRGALRLHDPASRIDNMRQRIDLLAARADRLLTDKLQGIRRVFSANAARLDVLSPLETLSRGYSITTRIADGRTVTDSAQLAVGDRLRLGFRRGGATGVVESLTSSSSSDLIS